MAKRAAFYVDGFNLYHGICDLQTQPSKVDPMPPSKTHLKWFSIWAFAEFITKQHGESIEKVHYFSALATHMPDSARRHQTYLRALKSTGVLYNLGTFKAKQKRMSFNRLDQNGNSYATAKINWTAHEEKETDVNIAIQLIQDAMDNTADVFYVISADTDLAPAVKLIRARYPNIEYVPVLPPKRAQNKELKQLSSRSGKHIEMKEVNVERCRLPEQITDATGTFRCPAEYALPV
jgi:uncharacterized LabA/DUF88 family protein